MCADIIEKIQIEGNKKVSRETIQFYMKSREGGIYDPDKLKEDFKALWETGFFENIRIEDENGANGKIVRLILVENPLISSVTYKTGKKVKESDINEKLQSSNIILQAFSYYSPAKIRKVKKIITDMLLEKGYNQAAVTIDEKNENGQIALTIHVDAGSKTRIADVVFPGLRQEFGLRRFPAPGHEKQPARTASFPPSPARTSTTGKRSTKTSRRSACACSRRATWKPRSGLPEFSMVTKKTVFGKLQKMLQDQHPGGARPALPGGQHHHRGQQGHPRRFSAKA